VISGVVARLIVTGQGGRQRMLVQDEDGRQDWLGEGEATEKRARGAINRPVVAGAALTQNAPSPPLSAAVSPSRSA
jgi:hypothetical protein